VKHHIMAVTQPYHMRPAARPASDLNNPEGHSQVVVWLRANSLMDLYTSGGEMDSEVGCKTMDVF
jgi:hypothetical protein